MLREGVTSPEPEVIIIKNKNHPLNVAYMVRLLMYLLYEKGGG